LDKKYISKKEFTLAHSLQLINSTTLNSNVSQFFETAKLDNSSGAYKLVEKLFHDKQLSNRAIVCFFSSFIVVGNKMYFYVMPTSDNRGSTITISSSAVSSGFRKQSTKFDFQFDITKDLSSTKMVIDVDTVVISADEPVALINYLTISGKTYAYVLYRAWSTIFPAMHKGIDVDKFIKFIDTLDSDPKYLEAFFQEWTFNDYNEWLQENACLTINNSLVIKQFFDTKNAKTKKDITNLQQTLIKVLSKTQAELNTWSEVDFDFDDFLKMAKNGFEYDYQHLYDKTG
jgi:hypothetical protein